MVFCCGSPSKLIQQGAPREGWPWGLFFGTATHPVVVSAVHVPGHAEVPDLHQEVLAHQAVPGGQVSVHEVLGRQVDHARSNLLGDVQHLRLRQLRRRVALGHQHGVRSVRPGENTEGLAGASALCLEGPFAPHQLLVWKDAA